MALRNSEQARQRLDDWLSRPMFLLSLIFLLVLGGLVHRFPGEHATDAEKQIMVVSLLVIWPAFWVEGLLRALFRDRSQRWYRGLAYPLLIVAFPPARLACWSYAGERRVWLPGWDWQEATADLRARLEHLFSIPMILIALLVLPILTVQYFWEGLLHREPLLNVALDAGSTLIWVAFVVEFTLMVAVEENRARYCRNHWLELLIIVLPAVDFMPLLRTLRLLRLAKPVLTYYARYYRLYGLVMKLWQYLLFWNLTARLRRRWWPLDPRKELRQVREQLREKEREQEAILVQIAALRRRAEELEAVVAARRKLAEVPAEETIAR